MRTACLPLAFGLALAFAAPGPLSAQSSPIGSAGSSTPAAADTLGLSLTEALAIGLHENPRLHQVAADRTVARAGIWDAWGNLLPQFSTQGQLQRSEQGTFVLAGREFDSPATYTTAYQWDFTHSLLDSGRDLFRIQEARAEVDRTHARFDATSLETAADIKTQYLAARRRTALVRQAEREVERREAHLDLARARYDVGAVTRSDVLQARLSSTQGEVTLLQARQDAQEARLALRRLLGGALEDRPVVLTSEFDVYAPEYEVETLTARALDRHPTLRETRAAQRAGEAQLWIARSAYLPTFQLQFSLARSIVDTVEFRFSDWNDRNFWAVSMRWPLFGRFDRYHQTTRAHASLESARAEERARVLEIEEQVRVAHSRLMTAYATHRANEVAVELAREDLRLGEARYETGTGSFVDLLDARVRAAEAETEWIASVYDFYLALVALERATGVVLFPEGAAE
ncbi:MAG: TolC family protein [Gemmatimonadota bacterium]|nr:TolC family protein [Gemmatimonadota bacterium]